MAVHYNQAAREILLGYRDAGEGLTIEELGERMSFANIEDAPVPFEQLPLIVALRRGRPAHLGSRSTSRASASGWRRRRFLCAVRTANYWELSPFWQEET
jgi:hypothetical protein